MHVPALFEFEFGPKTNTIIDLAEKKEITGDAADHMFLSGTIDRIDYIGSEHFGIVDYKTSSAIPKTEEIQSGQSLQLPLYLHAYQLLSGRTGIYGRYIQFKKMMVNPSLVMYDADMREYIPDCPSKSKVVNSELIEGTIKRVREYIWNIRGGYFPLPALQKCPNEWCPHRNICRYHEKRGSKTGEIVFNLDMNRDDTDRDISLDNHEKALAW
jgi:hypothetical protein